MKMSYKGINFQGKNKNMSSKKMNFIEYIIKKNSNVRIIF